MIPILLTKSRFLLFCLILFIPSVFANNLRGFCFSAKTSLDSVIREFKSVSLPNDNFYKRESLNCVEVKLTQARFNLYKMIAEKKFALRRTYSGNNNVVSDSVYSKASNCRIEILKVTKVNSKNNQFKLGQRSNLSAGRKNQSSTSTSRLLLAEGKSASLALDQNSVQLTCWPRGGVNAQIDVSLSSSSSNLMSSINVRKGQKINLGDVVEDLSNKSRDISLRNGVDMKKVKGQKITEFYLIYR